MSEEPRTVNVLVERLPEMRKALKRLQKKALRYGAQHVGFYVGDEFQEERTISTATGEQRILVRVAPVTVVGEAPKVGDYLFVARLTVTDGGVLVDAAPYETVPDEYRTTDGRCEHCRTDRRRKHVYVVRERDGGYKQVGRTCLRDYLGTDAPAEIAASFNWFRQAGNAVGEAYGGEPSLTVLDVVSYAVAACRLWGFRGANSYGDEAPTADMVNYALLGNPPPGLVEDVVLLRRSVGDADVERARAAILWASELGEDEDVVDYEWNLRVLARCLYAPLRLNLLASLPMAHTRALGDEFLKAAYQIRREAEAAENASSRHVGTAGERVEFPSLRLLNRIFIRTSKYPYCGDLYLYKFATEEGDVLTWFTSSGPSDAEIDARFHCRATVKSHGEYKGTKETLVTRARLTAVRG